MIAFVGLIAVFAAAYVLINYFATLKREQKKKVGAKAGVFAFIGTMLFLTLTGKLYLLAALGTGLVVFAKRLFPFLRYLPFLRGIYQKASANKKSGASAQSTVETSLLRMTLDHESGEVDGELLDTVSKGKYLSEFDMSALISLYTLTKTQYEDSTEVLAAYLDRKYGADWRSAASAANESGYSEQNAHTPHNAAMSKSDAYDVLGLEPNATDDEIVARHRKLMLKLHPDKGGSNYLAAKINQAKELLLGE